MGSGRIVSVVTLSLLAGIRVARADPEDILALLHEIGTRATSAPAPTDGPNDEIGAIGPCTRPGAAEKKVIAQRLARWIDATYPAEVPQPEEDGSDLDARFGCEDPRGVIVDVHGDRTVAHPTGRRMVGHWWTMRVTPTAITLVTDHQGLAVNDYMEWEDETEESTFALADLDGDGARDVVTVDSEHEGGAMGATFTFFVEPARGGAAVEIGHFHGVISGGAGTTAVVVDLANHFDQPGVFRCVTMTGLTSCPAARAAEAEARAVQTATQLAQLEEVPDRDALDEMLAAIDLLAPVRVVFDLLVDPTTPGTRAKRVVATFLVKRLGDDLTTEEAQAATDAAAERGTFAPLRAALGAAPCATSAPTAALAAQVNTWLGARYRDLACPGAATCAWKLPAVDSLTASCAVGTKSYAIVTWTVEDDAAQRQSRSSLLFVDGARVSVALDEKSIATFDGLAGADSGPAPAFKTSFYRRGDVLDALVIDCCDEGHAPPDQGTGPVGSGKSALLAFAGGAPTGSEPGDFGFLMRDWDTSDVIAVDQDGGEWTADDHLRLVRRGQTRPTSLPAKVQGDALTIALVDEERRNWAESTLGTLDGAQLSDPAYLGDVLEALRLVSAPSAVFDAVRAGGALPQSQ
jgi:hypothetical protein